MSSTARIPHSAPPTDLEHAASQDLPEVGEMELVDQDAELATAREQLRRSPLMAALSAVVVFSSVMVFALGAAVLADALSDPGRAAALWPGIIVMLAGVALSLLTRRLDRRIVSQHAPSGLAHSIVLGLGLLVSMLTLAVMVPRTESGLQALGTIFLTLAGISLGEALVRAGRGQLARAAVCALTFFALTLFSPLTPWIWLCLAGGAVIGVFLTLTNRQ